MGRIYCIFSLYRPAIFVFHTRSGSIGNFSLRRLDLCVSVFKLEHTKIL